MKESRELIDEDTRWWNVPLVNEIFNEDGAQKNMQYGDQPLCTNRSINLERCVNIKNL